MRANRYRQGVLGLLDRFTGKARRIAEQNRRDRGQEEEAARTKKETMIRQQIAERRQLQPKMQRLSKRQRLELDGLRQDMAALLSLDCGEGLDLLIDHGQDVKAARQSERQRQTSGQDEKKQQRRRRHRGRGRRRAMGDDPGPEYL